MAQPTIEDILALDGRIFAMLTPGELETLDFYRAQGRKYGVSIKIIGEVDSDELKRAKSQKDADQILRRTNSRVSVFVKWTGNGANCAPGNPW